MLPEVNFHDSYLADFSIGPRHELRITVELTRPSSQRTIGIRFSGIRNFDQVTAYFDVLKRLEDNERYIGEITALKQSSKRLYLIQLADRPALSIEAKKTEEIN